MITRTRPAHGFTLLEVMVAISIFALIGVASYTLLNTELRAQKQLQQHTLHLNHWQRGMTRLARDLLQAVPRSIREDYGSRKPAFIGSDDEMSLTRNGWSNPLDRQRSHLQRVHYRVVSDEEGGSYLERSFWYHLDRAPGSSFVQQQLLPGVSDMTLRYLSPEDQEWHPRWPNTETATAPLPRAVEITLQSGRFGKVIRLISLPETSRSDDQEQKP